MWTKIITDDIGKLCIDKGPMFFQNNNGNFEASIRKYPTQNRALSSKLAQCILSNRESGYYIRVQHDPFIVLSVSFQQRKYKCICYWIF